MRGLRPFWPVTAPASFVSYAFGMSPEEIERRFIAAGWMVADPSSRFPLVGNRGDISIVAHQLMIETDEPVFELVDRARVRGYWVRTIPTPWVAAELLEELGGPPEEQRGDPYKGGE
jgi:hypothetical protein